MGVHEVANCIHEVGCSAKSTRSDDFEKDRHVLRMLVLAILWLDSLNPRTLEHVTEQYPKQTLDGVLHSGGLDKCTTYNN